MDRGLIVALGKPENAAAHISAMGEDATAPVQPHVSRSMISSRSDSRAAPGALPRTKPRWRPELLVKFVGFKTTSRRGNVAQAAP
jgi:hypothetical protein